MWRAAWLAVVLAACPRPPAIEPPDAGVDAGSLVDAGDDSGVISAVIGPDGGSLVAPDGTSLVVPFDAVDHEVRVTLEVTDAGHFRFEPSGLVFARPVLVRLPTGLDGRSLHWSSPDGGFDELGGDVNAGFVSARVVRLAAGYVGAATQHRTVWGVVAETHVTSLGIENRFLDPRADLVTAQWRAADGVWDRAVATGFPDGTFVLRHVPRGELVVCRWSTCAVTDSSAVDFGRERRGRADAVVPAYNRPAVLRVSAANMAPWSIGDWLQLVSVKSGAFYPDVGWRGTAGATESSIWLQTNLYGSGNPLIDGSRGDRAFLHHATGRTSDAGFRYHAVSESCELPLFTQAETLQQSVACSFGAPVEWRETSASFDLGAFQSAVERWPLAPSDAGPQVPVARGGVLVRGEVLASPGDAREVIWPTATFVAFALEADAGIVHTGELAFAVSPVESWELIRRLDVGRLAQISLVLPGISTSFSAQVGVQLIREASEFERGPLRPAVGPVVRPLINGFDLFEARSGVGAPVTFSWQRPGLGAADRYEVSIKFLRENWLSTIFLVTSHTELAIPAGWLLPGDVLGVSIDAIASPGDTYAPRRYHFPYDSSRVLSAAFSP